MENMSIGKRIVTLRKAQGMTQDQLAEQVGVSAQAVSKWENDVSCPDISLLPRIAEIFSVTTDELLGVKPVTPHVVVVDKAKTNGNEEEEEGHSYSFTFNAPKGGLWLAIALLLVGAAMLLSRAAFWPFARNLSFWQALWPTVLLCIGLGWSFSSPSVFSVALGCLGLYCLLTTLGIVAYALSWGTILPAALILFGLSILIDALTHGKRRAWKKRHPGRSRKGAAEREFSVDGHGYVRYSCAFMDDEAAVTTDELSGGHYESSFGRSCLDLSNCRTASANAHLNLDISFGSAELILPRSIRAVFDTDRAFGSQNIKGAPAPDAQYELLITGDISFGSLEIRYV